MKQTVLFWILAVVITVASAVYQRLTGPTYPLSGTITLAGGHQVSYMLDRSHAGSDNAPVSILTGDSSIAGTLVWRPYKSSEEWQTSVMSADGPMLRGELPVQAPMKKIEYRVVLTGGGQTTSLPPEGPLMMRFKDSVPLWVIIPHVLVMFLAMLLATRTGLEAFAGQPSITRLTNWTLGSLFVGGFVLGPLATHYAFGLWWTGWPVGADITDNKTLIAFVVWAIAWAIIRRVKNPKPWVLAAALVMLAVFLIPHSVSSN
jgi:hypothetical protein